MGVFMGVAIMDMVPLLTADKERERYDDDNDDVHGRKSKVKSSMIHGRHNSKSSKQKRSKK